MYIHLFDQHTFCLYTIGTEKCSISEDQHRVPSLPELGVQPSDVQACKFPGGEREALLRMENCLKKTVSHAQCLFIFFRFMDKR